MNLNEIKSITLSLLKRETDIKDNTAGYLKKVTAKFTIPENFQTNEDNFQKLLGSMYFDLLRNAPEDVDSIGMWIEMDNITIDNALSLRTLSDIEVYSKEEISPIWEFFKMTIQ